MFQAVLIGVCIFFIIGGVVAIAVYRSGTSKETAQATIWGTMSKDLFNDFMQKSGLNQSKTISVTYVEKKSENFDNEFVNALASGRGPDLFFLTQDSILKHSDKVFLIPFESYEERTFKENFVEEAELYQTSAGFLGLPFIIDPMVMYWNRDIFSSAGLSVPPKRWSEFYNLASLLTKKDNNLNISKSVASLGEYSNVTHANELISTLIMQAGNPIVVRNADGMPKAVFNESYGKPVPPSEQAVNFYTEFSNPLKPFYSWNRSLPESKNFFLSGDLAVYFGFASELSDLRLKNPNLNFDVALMPQIDDSQRKITFGKMVALAIPRNSQNISGAFQVAAVLTSGPILKALSETTKLPPVRRDLLSEKQSQSYSSVFYESAVQARAWISPDRSQISPIFKDMIESITSGRLGLNESVTRASFQLLDLIE